MTWLLDAATAVGDLLAAPFGDHAGWALVVWSALFGLAAIVLFKLATPQARLAAARDRLVGRLLEAALYQTSLRTIVRVQGAALVANLRYLVLALPAIAALAIPLLLVLPQLEARVGRRALGVGEPALVVAAVASGASARLEGAAGLEVEAGPLRDTARGELVWRVRPTAAGRGQLRLVTDGREVALEVAVAEPGLAVVPASRHRGWFEQLLHDPGAHPLPADLPVTRLSVAAPDRDVRMAGLTLHWLVPFTVLSLAAGLLLKRPLRVEI